MPSSTSSDTVFAKEMDWKKRDKYISQIKKSWAYWEPFDDIRKFKIFTWRADYLKHESIVINNEKRCYTIEIEWDISKKQRRVRPYTCKTSHKKIHHFQGEIEISTETLIANVFECMDELGSYMKGVNDCQTFCSLFLHKHGLTRTPTSKKMNIFCLISKDVLKGKRKQNPNFGRLNLFPHLQVDLFDCWQLVLDHFSSRV